MQHQPVQLHIRRARESDRAALEAISAGTWDGHDYLPQYITDWLADEQGQFFAACLVGEDGQVIGSGKLTRFAEGEWWLEGLRVHPEMYGQGIGGALHRYAVRLAEERHRRESNTVGYVRLSTNLDNHAVHKIAAETGFVKAAEYRRFSSGGTQNPAQAAQFRAFGVVDIPSVRAFLGASLHYENTARSTIGPRWVCRFITDHILARTLDEQQVLMGWHGRRRDFDRLDGVLIGFTRPIPKGVELVVTYMDAIPGSLAVMAHAARALAGHMGCTTLWHMMLARPERLVAIEQAGWRRPADNGGKACVYSRQLEITNHNEKDE